MALGAEWVIGWKRRDLQLSKIKIHREVNVWIDTQIDSQVRLLSNSDKREAAFYGLLIIDHTLRVFDEDRRYAHFRRITKRDYPNGESPKKPKHSDDDAEYHCYEVFGYRFVILIKFDSNGTSAEGLILAAEQIKSKSDGWAAAAVRVAKARLMILAKAAPKG